MGLMTSGTKSDLSATSKCKHARAYGVGSTDIRESTQVHEQISASFLASGMIYFSAEFYWAGYPFDGWTSFPAILDVLA